MPAPPTISGCAGLLSVGRAVARVETLSALRAIWTLLGNIGYGFGPMVKATETFLGVRAGVKGKMIVTMLMGRLGLRAIPVLILPRFWRH